MALTAKASENPVGLKPYCMVQTKAAEATKTKKLPMAKPPGKVSPMKVRVAQQLPGTLPQGADIGAADPAAGFRATETRSAAG